VCLFVVLLLLLQLGANYIQTCYDQHDPIQCIGEFFVFLSLPIVLVGGGRVMQFLYVNVYCVAPPQVGEGITSPHPLQYSIPVHTFSSAVKCFFELRSERYFGEVF